MPILPGFPRYGQDDILPPRCPEGSFCPDEESGCRPLVPVGGACQLNRDGELQYHAIPPADPCNSVLLQISVNQL